MEGRALEFTYDESMRRIALGTTIVLTLATWGVLLVRIFSDGTNHVAVEPLLAVVPFVLLLLLACIGRRGERRSWRVVLTIYSLLSILAIVGLERANVLVQYERWIKRGMPERPCLGVEHP